jgi:peptide/nickel transport system substrate-binding protein
MVRSPTARRLLVSSLLPGLAAGLFTVAAVAATSTRDASQAYRAVHEGGTLMIGSRSLDFIDPALTQSFNSGTAVGLVSQGLEDATCALLFRYPVARPPVVRYDLVPEVATGYPAVSADGRTYTFTLRSGYRFSTGVPVTAGNFANAINRDLNPALRSPAAKYLQEVIGADAVQQGVAKTAAGVKVKGNKLIVRLTKGVPDFPARMTTTYFCPVPADLGVDPEGVGAPLPGSGPYYVSEFVRGSRAVLERNAYYRGPRAHHVDRIVFQLGGDSTGNTDKVEAGQLDVDLVVPLSRLDAVGAKYPVNKGRFFSIPSTTVFYIYMNTEGPLFKHNPKLRQAVNFALDRSALLADLGPYFGSTTDGYLPPRLPGWIDVHPYPLKHPDLKRALALAHGHTRSGKAVWYACSDVGLACIPVAETVQANLKAIGIDVQINSSFPYTVKAARTATRGEPFDMADDRYQAAWVDPSQYINVLLDGRTIQATGNTDLSYFNSTHYNSLMDQAGRLSGAPRSAAYGSLALLLAKNAAPMAAFIARNNRFFVSSRIGCVTAGVHDLDLAGLCIK